MKNTTFMIEFSSNDLYFKRLLECFEHIALQ